MMCIDNPVLAVVFAAVFFYVLYGVIRGAVRDGILQADERRQEALLRFGDVRAGSEWHGGP
ncbi:conserved hypothetical protein [Arthrobacter sp. 9AX]|uniref:hypothetical protein n=1 Tax=Arthrobacter sp. 9AX TaxID=2653131 RepID=UPI0012F1D422|nr:hypothetical protein [Arthrobacter sp. 9AX]VXC19354.1 conserved hypothetical protein [Arthrobacter sp. 9AX]